MLDLIKVLKAIEKSKSINESAVICDLPIYVTKYQVNSYITLESCNGLFTASFEGKMIITKKMNVFRNNEADLIRNALNAARRLKSKTTDNFC